MPLVVPGMMTSGASANSHDNSNEAWMNKLLGKTLTDGPSDETVRKYWSFSSVKTIVLISCVKKFSKKDLPKEHRIVEHGQAVTMDHAPDRLNIQLGPDGTVMKTTFDDGRS